MKNFKNKNGITLIALVVTIVVLLILTGITINLVLADGGIFKRAQGASKEQKKAEILDKLTIAEADLSIEYLGKTTLEQYITYIGNGEGGTGIVSEANKIDDKNYEVIEDGLIFNISIVEGNSVNDIVIEYIGEDGQIRMRTNVIQNSIKVEVVNVGEQANYKYEIKLSTQNEYDTEKTVEVPSNSTTFTNLTYGATYDINVTVTIEGETDPKVLTKQIGIQDTIAPNEAEIVISGNSLEDMTATITHTDNDGGTGINLISCKWIHNQSETKLGENSTAWNTANTFSSDGESINLETSSVGTYYLHVLSVDKAGNKVETVKRTIVILYDNGAYAEGFSMGNDFTYATHPDWYNGTQQMTIEQDRISFNITKVMEMQNSYSNLIDFADASKVFTDVNVEIIGSATYNHIYTIVDLDTCNIYVTDSTDIPSSPLNTTGKHTIECDVSSYVGTGYIRLQAQNHGGKAYVNKGYFTKIYYY